MLQSADTKLSDSGYPFMWIFLLHFAHSWDYFLLHPKETDINSTS